MKEILLTKGKTAIVDDEDFKIMKQYNWHYLNSGYACRDETIDEADGNTEKKVLMHRSIVGVGKNEVVDHINGNKLDNRKVNLRVATVSQNSANSKKRPGCVSKYKGVGYFRWGKRQARWSMRITKDGKRVRREYYHTEKEAAQAYNRAAIELFGEYALLNIIDEIA